MSLRARTRNSSGRVATSRRPTRLSATSGWLLTFSGTVVLDQTLKCFHCDAQHAVHVRRIEVMDLARAELVDAEVDRARTKLPQSRDDEERRRLHVVAEHARARPHLELFAELMQAWHALGDQVRVKRVDGSNDAHVIRRARCAARIDESVDDVA